MRIFKTFKLPHSLIQRFIGISENQHLYIQKRTIEKIELVKVLNESYSQKFERLIFQYYKYFHNDFH